MRMLLVEDDAALNQRLKTALSEAGFAVDVVENGLEAEYMVEVGTYDVVVLDLGLPGRSGLEVLQSWRERGNIMPVLILTARLRCSSSLCAWVFSHCNACVRILPVWSKGKSASWRKPSQRRCVRWSRR